MNPEIAIVISFSVCVWIFIKKIYPFIVKALDEYIESVKNKICEAELQKEKASLALQNARAKKDNIGKVIEENQKALDERIEQLRKNNEEYLKVLHKRLDATLEAQLESESAKQKSLLIKKLSDQIIEKLTEQIHTSDREISVNFAKEDLQKLA